MIHIPIPKGRLLLIALPDYAQDPWLINHATQLAWYDPNRSFGEEGNTYSESKDIPSGNWKILGWSDSNENHKALNITQGEYMAMLLNNGAFAKHLLLIEKE